VHCDHERCGGDREHNKGEGTYYALKDDFYWYVPYLCRNCAQSVKVFGLKAQRQGETSFGGICTKIYQEPPFGLPIPKRLFQVIGEANREHFLNARRAIARGLGIGAYAYYRRIVESTNPHIS